MRHRNSEQIILCLEHVLVTQPVCLCTYFQHFQKHTLVTELREVPVV